MGLLTPPVRAAVVYDAASVCGTLGLPNECQYTRLLKCPEGQVVIWYGGWDLSTLRTTPVGEQYLTRDRRHDHAACGREAGYYRLLLPVPDSSGRSWNEQVEHIHTSYEGWYVAPAALVATAALVHLALTGDDLLPKGMCRCAEGLDDRHVLGLGGLGNLMLCSTRDRDRSDHLAIAAFRAY